MSAPKKHPFVGKTVIWTNTVGGWLYPVRVLAVVDDYAMVRRFEAAPFVVQLKELSEPT